MESYYFQMDELSVGYNGKPLIEHINIGVKKGEIVTLIGPNGSGKSTILKSITRQLRLLGGRVSFDEQNIHQMSYREMSTKMAVVLTERMRPELMTCHDIVATGRYPYTGRLGILSREDEKKVEEAMCAVHARELGSRDFNAISDGQRQRVLLARAICQEPEVIVLDEPTSFLDVKHKLELLAILRRMAKEKQITVIMSLHEIDLAKRSRIRSSVSGAITDFIAGHRRKSFRKSGSGSSMRSTMDFSIRVLAALSCRVRKDCRRCLLSLHVAAESRFTAGCRRRIHRLLPGFYTRMTLTISLRGCFRAR